MNEFSRLYEISIEHAWGRYVRAFPDHSVVHYLATSALASSRWRLIILDWLWIEPSTESVYLNSTRIIYACSSFSHPIFSIWKQEYFSINILAQLVGREATLYDANLTGTHITPISFRESLNCVPRRYDFTKKPRIKYISDVSRLVLCS